MKGFWLATIAAFCAGGAHLAKSPYLPQVGPMPLRTREPEEGAKFEMRPLEQPIPHEDEAGSTNALADSVAVREPENGPTPSADIRTNAPPAANPAPAPEPPPTQSAGSTGAGENVVTPQMFLRFFNQGGNRETIITPGSVPQAQAQPGQSSSATYIVK